MQEINKKIAVSGGFDPVHIGHIRMFEEASKLGDVVVFLNSDDFLKEKKGKIFMPYQERKEVLESIKFISEVIPVIDTDMTVCETLRLYKPDIFANGGDRKAGNIPEYEICNTFGIELVFDIGGGKIQSSSELCKNYGRI